jgi:uncharacterized protein (DUF885 family)
MRDVVERFDADWDALARLHDAPMSPARRERLKSFAEERLGALAAADFDRLPQEGKVDAVLLANHLRHEIREIARGEALDREVEPLVPFWNTIVELVDARRKREGVDAAQAAGKLTELAKAVKASRKDASRTLARRASERVDALRRALERWHKYHAGYDPLYTWWASKPYEEADRELKEYGAHLSEKAGLKKEGAEGLVGDPLGREALLAELDAEMIPYSPEELIAAAEREFAWCEERMREASRELGCGDDWAKALEKVKSIHAEPGKQPALIRQLALEAEEYLEKRELVTVPPLCKEVWRMEMMSPDRQKTTPYFTGGEVISISYPTSDMAHDLKQMVMRGNNVHFARATVHHELIPGHHLQGFMSQRHRTHRRLFRTAFLVEGWALYWELRLWDLGFQRSAEDRVGMLFWRAHRCARIITTLRFHLGKMSPQEMVEFLVKRVGHEPAGAEAEVRRYIGGSYGPLYQCAYLVGGWQLRALQKELVGSGKLTERQFHDAVLRENSIPIEMIRASLAGVPLSRDFKPSWKFLD